MRPLRPHPETETDSLCCVVLCCAWLFAELLAFLWPVARAPSASQPPSASRSPEVAATAARRKLLQKLSSGETAFGGEDTAM